LRLAQRTAPTPGQAEKTALPIPVKLALFDASGAMLPLHLGDAGDGATERVIVLDRAEQSLVFAHVDAEPVPSLLRDFSAPAILEFDYSPQQLALLLRHDVDGFNRWEAGQQLAAQAYDALRDGNRTQAVQAWCDALVALFTDDNIDDALLADLLTPPSEIELAEREQDVDPARIHDTRRALQAVLAERIGANALAARYRALAAQADDGLDAASQAGRRLKQCVLELWQRVDSAAAQAAAAVQCAQARTMTDRLAALALLVHSESADAPVALAQFRARHGNDPLAMDKWFAVQALVPGEGALARVQALAADPAFTLKNPNRVRALLGGWSRSNLSGFHRADGAGYRYLADRLRELDALNPQIAARLATVFNGWRRLEQGRREQARGVIASLAAESALSRNLGEIVRSMLGD
jgi:aminopeptidase N